MTQASRIHSPGIITVLNLMGLSIHMPGECMTREQRRIGIIIRLFKNGRISCPVISLTCLCEDSAQEFSFVENRGSTFLLHIIVITLT